MSDPSPIHWFKKYLITKYTSGTALSISNTEMSKMLPHFPRFPVLSSSLILLWGRLLLRNSISKPIPTQFITVSWTDLIKEGPDFFTFWERLENLWPQGLVLMDKFLLVWFLCKLYYLQNNRVQNITIINI